MDDLCLLANVRSGHLEIAVAVTTGPCRAAQDAHKLGATSAVALGRLLTGVALLTISSKRLGTTSIQIVSQGHMRGLYADATLQGHLRGMAKVTHLAFPITKEEARTGRRSVGPALHPGKLSVVRADPRGDYGQSAVPLITGEVDMDLEAFLGTSEQMPSAVACETLLNADGTIARAAGVLIKAQPDGDIALLEELRNKVVMGGLVPLLQNALRPEDLLTALHPDAVVMEPPTPLVWRCRCSAEKVQSALKLFGPTDLAEMIEKGEPVPVDCDLCAKQYLVAPEDVRRIFEEIIRADA